MLMPALKGPKGDQMVGRSNYSEYGRDALVITSANQNPELTMRWVDQLYAPKESAQVNWGPIGEIYKEDSNGMLVNKNFLKAWLWGIKTKSSSRWPIYCSKR
ncbi:hypothetical protein AAAC51_18080 [Priestia megaterium]